MVVALAFLPIRFAVGSEHKNSGTILGVEDFLEVVITLLEDFNKIDPFICIGLRWVLHLVFRFFLPFHGMMLNYCYNDSDTKLLSNVLH